jgi:hypothetical protein
MGPAAVFYQRVNSLMKSLLQFIASLSQGWASNYSVDQRYSGSFFKHKSTKLQKSDVHLF